MLERILEWYQGDKRFLVLVAPTGAGKSLLSLATQRALNKRVHTLVSKVRLQDQMRTSYANAPVLKGRDHYPCLIIPDLPVSEAPCQVGFKCALINECDYFVDRKSAYASPYAVFNYALYLTMASNPQPITPPDLMFCDEAHLIEHEIENYYSATITMRDILSQGWPTPPDYTTIGLADWASKIYNDVLAEYEQCRKRVFGAVGSSGGSKVLSPKSYARAIARYNRAKYMVTLVERFIQAGADTEAGHTWVTEKVNGATTITPVHVDDYAHSLFNLAPRTVLMSATMSKKDIERIGVTDYDYYEIPSAYPAANRPIIYRPVGAINSYNEKVMMADIVDEIDDIVKHHSALKERGIIHSASYERSNTIRSMSKYKDLMMVHDDRNKSEVINQFKASPEPSVLISPSILEGEDFPGDECSYVIIPKIPFLSLGSPVVRERKEEDPEWYTWRAVKDTIQGAGRGMRSADDQCRIYILDAQFEKILETHGSEIPHWFLEAIVGLDDEFKRQVGMIS